MPLGRSNSASVVRSNLAVPPDRVRSPGARHMRNFRSRATAAAVGAIAISSVAIGSAAAADVPQGQLQPPAPEYYRGGSVEDRYVYQQPPAIYGYPPPPPVSYYEYGPPPIVVLPEPYYLRRHYALVYGGPSYGVRHYPPHVARGFGRYDRPWDRGHHRW
jgi:hypothetical protein